MFPFSFLFFSFSPVKEVYLSFIAFSFESVMCSQHTVKPLQETNFILPMITFLLYQANNRHKWGKPSIGDDEESCAPPCHFPDDDSTSEEEALEDEGVEGVLHGQEEAGEYDAHDGESVPAPPGSGGRSVPGSCLAPQTARTVASNTAQSGMDYAPWRLSGGVLQMWRQGTIAEKAALPYKV